jgi:hypothetical protein
MSKPPVVDILPEIIKQGFRRRKDILYFFIAHVLVAPLAWLVIVTEHAQAVYHKGQSIL